MKSPCDIVAERVALGEPVGEADHVAGCALCQRTIRLPSRIATAHADVDPGLGFSARITAGAQKRITVRKRRRVVGGVAASALASALGVVIVLHPSGDRLRFDNLEAEQPTPTMQPHDHDKPREGAKNDLAALVNFADLDRTSHYGTNWGRIEKPLAPYRALVQGVKP